MRENRAILEQLSELFWGQPCCLGDSTHGDCIDRIVSRNHQTRLAVRHDDVPAFARDAVTYLLKDPDCVTLADARIFDMLHSDLGKRAGFLLCFAQSVFFCYLQPKANCFPYILQRFVARFAL
jgi:hypothetical protein